MRKKTCGKPSPKTAKGCFKEKICFPELCFTKPGVYTYIIREYIPACGNWETDPRIFRVVVTIKQDSDGNLTGAVEYPDGFPEFLNRFKPMRKHCVRRPCGTR